MNRFSVLEDVFSGLIFGVAAFVAYQLAVNIFQLGYELGAESVKKNNVVPFKSQAECAAND